MQYQVQSKSCFNCFFSVSVEFLHVFMHMSCIIIIQRAVLLARSRIPLITWPAAHASKEPTVIRLDQWPAMSALQEIRLSALALRMMQPVLVSFFFSNVLLCRLCCELFKWKFNGNCLMVNERQMNYPFVSESCLVSWWYCLQQGVDQVINLIRR